MKLKWTRVACAALTVAALGGALSGCVALVGGGAAVAGMSAVDRRTTGTQVEDQGIELRAGNRISEVMGEKARVSATSYNRVVLLTGQAGNATDKATIEKLVREQATVREVYNEIEVVPFTATLGQRSQDSLITTKVKASLVDMKTVSAISFKVTTERGVVYLMGLVTPREGNIAADVAKGVSGVTRVVKIFEYINEEDPRVRQNSPAQASLD
jgi:osmotically-inducible protein OsmY